MNSMETPRPGGGDALSTEDLTGAGRRDTDGRDTESAAPDLTDTPPAYPGEATASAGAGPEDRRDDAGQARASADEPRRAAEPAGEEEPLLGGEEEEFRARWQQIQSRFVDDPRESVNAADQLVAETMQALATTFSAHKRDLEGQWHRGEEVATEDLRVALQQYRSFFNRLLST
ncbi:hypothetical protein OG432_00895 [Streptomyces sp. NBC_00442]|uniref:hypothetical protein n=1 Tax=Streptomyces sp. NBC_00442 TaxID=2903651 RepID=UPI002E246D5C